MIAIVALIFVVLSEYYGFLLVKQASMRFRGALSVLILYSYLVINAVLWIYFISYRYWGFRPAYQEIKSIFAVLFIALAAWKFVALCFLLTEDIYRIFRFSTKKFFSGSENNFSGTPMKRSEFIQKTAIVSASVPAGALIFGAINNAYNYQFRRVRLSFSHLPAAFDGFTIVQLSDIHSGSLTRKEPVLHAIEKINALHPDLIVFTGDLVNHVADEISEYAEIFSRLTAVHGVLSITGNHDYGDYVAWNSLKEKQANFQKLLQWHKDMGWHILLNENKLIEKDGSQLAVLGCENWSARLHFPRYGNLGKAMKGAEG
ncbi:MAG: metallophosphoesterase, partial [Chitinophagales bacterium]|nr:metallophosphoesterase [Chitinophagales bacterium]